MISEKKRRIRAKRLRGEWSEGLLMPLSDFTYKFVRERGNNSDLPVWKVNGEEIEEGMDLAKTLGITHYVPPEEPELSGDDEHGPGSKQNKIFPRSLKGWMYFLARVLTFGLYDPNGPTGGANERAPEEFRPIFDVEAYKNFPGLFQPGELVAITEKIHGSNGRFTFSDNHMYAGSRKLWKKKGSKNIWREALKQEPWIEEWCRKHPGYTLYGEVVPTQKGFKYGAGPGEVRFFVFDIRIPEGEWVDWLYLRDVIQLWKCNQTSLDGSYLRWVPILYEGPFSEEKLFQLADGASEVPDADNVREGVVVRPKVERQAGVHGLGRLILKVVSNKFLEADNV